MGAVGRGGRPVPVGPGEERPRGAPYGAWGMGLRVGCRLPYPGTPIIPSFDIDPQQTASRLWSAGTAFESGDGARAGSARVHARVAPAAAGID